MARPKDKPQERVVLGYGYPLVQAKSVSLHECDRPGANSSVALRGGQVDCCAEKAAGRRWRLVLERVR